MTQRLLQLDELMGFAQDLDDGFANRKQPRKPSFVFDANIVWFLENAEAESDRGFGGHTSKALGQANATALMRWSVSQLMASEESLMMLEGHKREADMAFAERHDWDYASLVDALRSAVNSARKERPNAQQDELAQHAVETLKADYTKPFQVLSDAMRQKKRHDEDFVTRSRTQRVRPGIETPGGLLQRLNQIGDTLSFDGKRAPYSVRQDIKALQDLALLNLDNPGKKTILLTLDKRLIEAVRIGRLWNDVWSTALPVESLDTFWIWFLGQSEEAPAHELFGDFRDILDDYRFYAKTMFLRDGSSVEDGNIWLSQSEWLREFASPDETQHPAATEVEQNASLRHAKRQVAKAFELQKMQAHSDNDIRALRQKCTSFFNEVSEMLPTLQISSVPGLDQSEHLKAVLSDVDLSVDAFFDAISHDIQAHASRSIRILGAATMFAPKILSAFDSYLETASMAAKKNSFIQRMPLPIQSDDFDLNEIATLVTNRGPEQDQRFDILLDRKIRTGPVADLIIAFLLVHGGDWQEARRICRTTRMRISGEPQHAAVLYEIKLLEAAILRIYKTDPTKLDEATELLKLAQEMSFNGPSTDPGGVRIELENQAIAVNRILLQLYFEFKSIQQQPSSTDIDKALDVLERIFTIKEVVEQEASFEGVLREKMIANANTNIFLIQTFVLREEISRWDEVAGRFKKALMEGVERMSSTYSTRVSFFEQVVTCYTILRNRHLIEIPGERVLTIRAMLDTNLRYLLQRKDDINRFEYWIFREVNSEIEEFRATH